MSSTYTKNFFKDDFVHHLDHTDKDVVLIDKSPGTTAETLFILSFFIPIALRIGLEVYHVFNDTIVLQKYDEIPKIIPKSMSWFLKVLLDT